MKNLLIMIIVILFAADCYTQSLFPFDIGFGFHKNDIYMLSKKYPSWNIIENKDSTVICKADQYAEFPIKDIELKFDKTSRIQSILMEIEVPQEDIPLMYGLMHLYYKGLLQALPSILDNDEEQKMVAFTKKFVAGQALFGIVHLKEKKDILLLTIIFNETNKDIVPFQGLGFCGIPYLSTKEYVEHNLSRLGWAIREHKSNNSIAYILRTQYFLGERCKDTWLQFNKKNQLTGISITFDKNCDPDIYRKAGLLIEAEYGKPKLDRDKWKQWNITTYLYKMNLRLSKEQEEIKVNLFVDYD